MKQQSRSTVIRETITWEFESDAERREFMRHINSFGRSAVVVEKDGTRRKVRDYQFVINGHNFKTAIEFVKHCVKQFGKDGVTGRELLGVLNDNRIMMPYNTLSATLSNLKTRGEIISERTGNKLEHRYYCV